ncbi:SHOCT domain-containing protein [Lactococcus garvieae]|uniref:SHOCT domain-containing protein n=1 Tax=Lactococcus garvieae TaxID=1363 RepID=UPI0022E1073F|nr:SHOCT domain-containing protein [Lactococcus garvieae]
MQSYIDELKELKTLLNDGILTQEEFDTQKARLLNSVEIQDETTNQTINTNPIITDSKTQCGSCGSKVNMFTRFKLSDGNYICVNCIKKAGLTTSTANQEYMKQSVTLSNLFDAHNTKAFKQDQKAYKQAIKCPKCKSTEVVFMQQDKKGFSVGKAVGGAVLTGGIGTLAGFAGKKGKKQWHCNNCGRTFETKK